MRFLDLRATIGAICLILVLGISSSVLPSRTAVSTQLDDVTPYVPDPSECTIEPRSVPPPPVATPSASPVTLATLPPPGPLVPSDNVAEISEVVRGAIACTNAGDTLRALAYFTDEYVESMFSGPDGVDYEGFLQYLSTPVAVLDEANQLAIIDISEVRQHKIGIVSAVVTTSNTDDEFEDFIIFVNENGNWLIAGWGPVETIYATPGP